jgi:hypothetical protein
VGNLATIGFCAKHKIINTYINIAEKEGREIKDASTHMGGRKEMEPGG